MDVDRFVSTHQPAWDRLDVLVGRAGRSVRQLSPAELEELVALYQQVSTHLSLARTAYREPALTASLTRLTARAGAVVYGTRPRTLRAFAEFFTVTFPAALWHARAFIAVSAVVFCVPALAFGVWIARSPAALEASAPAELREAYVEDEFLEYYEPSPEFAATVGTNNIQVGILAFASGIAFCALTVLVLLYNGISLGMVGGLFAAVGRLDVFFFGGILPHGFLELTAVFIAGGAGLRLGWTLIDPGDRPRGAALVQEGRRAIVIVMGLVVVFGVAALIEGFITGADLPAWFRVGLGALVWLSFLFYAWRLGRAAASRGYTGALGEGEARGWAADPRAATAARLGQGSPQYG
jgi:uncharacterized membrane protein SpoIIM required for sporulation